MPFSLFYLSIIHLPTCPPACLQKEKPSCPFVLLLHVASALFLAGFVLGIRAPRCYALPSVEGKSLMASTAEEKSQ